jgi:ArsR family transcriptional regulator, arsenate/arsenite/antimonite-responsive transcriptional repressor
VDERQALSAFAALSQETRLRILRHLVVAGPEGLPAGAIAERVEVSASNVSFHLKELERAGLLSARREGRSIIYCGDFSGISDLIRFVLEDCCSGHPEICQTAASFAACCTQAETVDERARLQRAVSVHRKLGPVDSG